MIWPCGLGWPHLLLLLQQLHLSTSETLVHTVLFSQRDLPTMSKDQPCSSKLLQGISYSLQEAYLYGHL